MTVILASTSPRRRELLTKLGVAFEVVPSNLEERDAVPGENPSLYAEELALLKAGEVHACRLVDTILAADTVVALDGMIFGKPVDAGDAIRMLSTLRGRTHSVSTAVVVRCREQVFTGTVTAAVTMREVSDAAIEAYVATGEPMDKAGAYAVQGAGGKLVERVSGCYYAVVGLPLCVSGDFLRRCEVAIPVDPNVACRHEQT